MYRRKKNAPVTGAMLGKHYVVQFWHSIFTNYMAFQIVYLPKPTEQSNSIVKLDVTNKKVLNGDLEQNALKCSKLEMGVPTLLLR